MVTVRLLGAFVALRSALTGWGFACGAVASGRFEATSHTGIALCGVTTHIIEASDLKTVKKFRGAIQHTLGQYYLAPGAPWLQGTGATACALHTLRDSLWTAASISQIPMSGSCLANNTAWAREWRQQVLAAYAECAPRRLAR